MTRAAWPLLVAMAACAPARADDPGFELRVVAPATIELGGAAAVSVALVPGPGRVVSTDGPVRIALDADAGLGLPRRRYLRADAADPAADAPRFDVKVRAQAAGAHALAIEARFWLCARQTCRPIVATRAVTITVATPPIDAGVDAPIDAGRDAAVDAGRRRGRP
ncbi:MAG: hypothetical protein IPL61_04940 [Myxococcales bacterium]|nr:hypothetical protein [Myxococcales bacterium]